MAEVHSDLNSLSKLYLLFLCGASFLPFRSLKLQVVKWATEGVIMFFFEAGKSKTECCRFERTHDSFTNEVKNSGTLWRCFDITMDTNTIRNIMQRRYTVFWMLQCYYKRIFWFSLRSKRQRSITGRRETRRKGETGTKYKELVPSFFGWVDYGEERGGEGMVRGGQMNRNLH